ncbi:MAG: permease-like cell division protein FtsX [Pseudomonadota bacterium]
MNAGQVLRIGYHVRAFLMGVKSNPALFLVAAATIALAMLIMGAFLLLNVNLQNILESSARGLAVSVYLEDGLGSAGLERLKKEVENLSGVAETVYLSKEQALAELEKRLGDQTGLLEGLDENPLPSSLELEMTPDMKEEDQVQELAGRLKSLAGVAEVHFVWEWAEKLRSFVRFVRVAGFVVGVFLFMTVVFIVANTIKLTVLARQDELYIMRLVGATEGFIRAPFLIEGAAQGLSGALAALVVLFLVYVFIISRIELPLGLSMVGLTFLSGTTAFFLVVAGVALGLVGSFISLGRFLQK